MATRCHNSLGIMWRDGLTYGRKDSKFAFKFTHFAVAAGQALAGAQVNLRKHHHGKYNGNL